MALQLHNLLVAEEKRAVRRMYYTRVLALGLMLIAGAVLVGVAALVPSYILMSGERTYLNDQIKTLSVGVEDREAITQDLASVQEVLTVLSRYVDSDHMTGHLDRVLAIKPATIQLSGLSYEDASDAVVLQGVAGTRADLVGYTNALEQDERIAQVVLPIAALAKNTDVSFSITITFVHEPKAAS